MPSPGEPSSAIDPTAQTSRGVLPRLAGMLLRVSIALLVFLVTIELTARAARYFVPAGQSNDNPFPFIVPDPVLGWTNAPTPLLPQLAFDPRGYRLVPHASDQKAINVLCLGDSGT
ncbi:MAG TPA: hypothetical protein PK869_12280, partial [Candidatus Hydrogenedentes bacterium]|nr:hypothetical protein [Candidatus Hydrogenedentota bacterium]